MTSRPTVLASTVLALALLGDSLLYAALPLHASTFGVSLAWVGVLLSANRIIRLLAYPFLPRLAATGLRRFTAGAAAVGAVSTLTFAFGSAAWTLLASRLAWGVAFGSLSLSSLAYATARSDAAGKRVGWSLSLRELGPLFSLTAGVAGVAAFGVRPALAALGIISLAGVLVATLLPGPEVGSEARSAGVLRRPRNAEWLSLVAGFVTDGVFPATIALLLARSAGAGEAIVGAGMLLGFKRIAVVVLAPLGGHAADRFGGSAVTAAGFAAGAIGALCIGFDHVVAGAVLLSCGAAVTTTSIPVSVATQNGEERVSAFARVAMARDAGAAAGPLAALLLFDAAGAAVLYCAAGVLMAVMAANAGRAASLSPRAGRGSSHGDSSSRRGAISVSPPTHSSAEPR